MDAAGVPRSRPWSRRRCGALPGRAGARVRPAVRPVVLLVTSAVALAGGITGCVGEPGRSVRQGAEALIPTALAADELPVMLNETSPFYYPVSAWDQRIQGNVTLRLHIDVAGRAVRESTTVARTSGIPSLDSAAVAGSAKLRFRAARKDGAPMAVSLLFPVHFRHPDGPPLPGDTADTLPGRPVR